MAGDFLAGLGTGAVVGAAGAEFVKMISGAAVKRRFDQSAEKRKLVREDTTELAKAAGALVELALKYYGRPSGEGKDVADQIRSGLKTFGVRWNTTQNRVGELGLAGTGTKSLVRFRQALTSRLDVERAEPLAIDSHDTALVFSAFAEISEALSSLRYRAV